MIIKPIKTVILLFLIIGMVVWSCKQLRAQEQITPAQPWLAINGEHINAHGGGIIYFNDAYYWFGEKRGKSASEGVNVYSSTDLVNWKAEGLALATITDDPTNDIARGCIIERPKVIYNSKTKQFVMWFHLELRGQGYNAARAGVAVSDNVIGPYHFLKSFRPNGNMSRDMTLFVDENGEAYQIYSSNDNYDLRIVRLSDDYLSPTTQDSLLFSKHREAPALFKVKGNYYLITSGCTGWAPNKASVHVAKSLFGPWRYLGDPMSGPDSEITFGAQSTFVFQIPEKNKWIFMADKWNPRNLTDSRYVWLPIDIDRNGDILIQWKEKWSPAE